MATPNLRGRFVWHELLTSDSAGGMKFYGKVANWKTEPYPDVPGYSVFMAKRGPIAGTMTMPDMPPNWLSYIGTPDVDATAAQAVSLGAKLLQGPATIPPGRFAILSDPQGAAFAIYTPNLMEDSDPKPQVGEFSWHELVTSDPDAAWSFYSTLFGWEKTTAMDMGDLGVYQMYGLPGLELGGIYKKPSNYPAPPNWLPYIMVADAKKATAISNKLSGKVMNGPMQVPGGGWIMMGMDPQGAAFAVHSAAAAAPAKKAAPKKKKAAAKKAAPKKKAVARKSMKKAAKKAVKKAVKKSAKKAAPKKKGKKRR